MSGGSMDYLYGRVEQAAFHTDTTERAAFARHLQLIAKALHDIEWVDSADYGPGDETAAIMACLSPGAMLAETVLQAEEALRNLSVELGKAKK